MIALLFVLHLALVLAAPAPEPGRVPKVYNALITSNQNLQPSKAYPVYQPVLHDTFAFPFSPVFYPEYPNLYPLPNNVPAQPQPRPQPHPQPPAGSPPENTPEERPSEPAPQPSEKPSPGDGETKAQPTPAPHQPPKTESPIPLNQFGLPPQVLPLGRYDPAYDGFTQVASPFSYSYPGIRFYDPYDPFAVNPYLNLPPLYRPLPNTLSQGSVLDPQEPVAKVNPPKEQQQQSSDSPSSPPPEPNDLSILNYSSKDPSIPNVPPPPLPHGGLQSDKSDDE